MKRPLIIVTLIFLFFLNHGIAQQQVDHQVYNIHQSSPSVSSGHNFTLSLSTYSDFVKSIRVTYCQITPDYICHFPSLKMAPTDLTNHSFSVTFKVLEENGASFGYKFIINYSNSSLPTEIPVKNSLTFGNTIVEATPSNYYYKVSVQEQSNSSSVENTKSTNNVNTSANSAPLLYVWAIPILLIKKKFQISHKSF